MPHPAPMILSNLPPISSFYLSILVSYLSRNLLNLQQTFSSCLLICLIISAPASVLYIRTYITSSKFLSQSLSLPLFPFLTNPLPLFLCLLHSAFFSQSLSLCLPLIISSFSLSSATFIFLFLYLPLHSSFYLSPSLFRYIYFLPPSLSLWLSSSLCLSLFLCFSLSLSLWLSSSLCLSLFLCLSLCLSLSLAVFHYIYQRISHHFFIGSGMESSALCRWHQVCAHSS